MDGAWATVIDYSPSRGNEGQPGVAVVGLMRSAQIACCLPPVMLRSRPFGSSSTQKLFAVPTGELVLGRYLYVVL